MNKLLLVILLHQILFQLMFVAKNLILKKKIGKAIRGKNKEATYSIIFFIIFISLSIVFTFVNIPLLKFKIINSNFVFIVSNLLLVTNLLISAAALVHLKDSWRVGVLEDEKTDLVTDGIYRISRNPYFLSYIIMFFAYAILLQNILLFGLLFIGIIFIHNMIKKEEEFLVKQHGDNYKDYMKKTARYLLF